jgi:phage terminase large subunit-like protein
MPVDVLSKLEGKMKRADLTILALGFFLLAQTAQAQWSPAKKLTWTPGASWCPAIAIDSSNHIHVLFYDDTPGNNEIYYLRSLDGGATWSLPTRLTWTSAYSERPAMAIDSSNLIHVVWVEGTPGNAEIYYLKSPDGGSTWSKPQRLTWTSGASDSPAIAIDSKNGIHVSWNDYTPGATEIYYKKSTNGGATWSALQNLSLTSGHSYASAIVPGAGNAVHVVWHDFTPGAPEIYYRRSTDRGTTWGPVKRLTWTSGWSMGPAIGKDSNNNLHVVWSDDTPGKAEIYYRRSTNGGATWGANQRLTWNSGLSDNPAIAIDSGNAVHLVWYDETPGNAEVYYRKSPDGGATWGAVQRLTWNSGSSLVPAVAVDSSKTVHVVWFDDTSGNWDIYYKKGK